MNIYDIRNSVHSSDGASDVQSTGYAESSIPVALCAQHARDTVWGIQAFTALKLSKFKFQIYLVTVFPEITGDTTLAYLYKRPMYIYTDMDIINPSVHLIKSLFVLITVTFIFKQSMNYNP